MHHSIFFYGNPDSIAWTIKTNHSIVNQSRKHVTIYRNKVTDIQSKYVALHVGLFWGIGVFIIKNEDHITIKMDEKVMFQHFTLNLKDEDKFVQKRKQFIDQLSHQRNLKIIFERIEVKENLAAKSIQ